MEKILLKIEFFSLSPLSSFIMDTVSKPKSALRLDLKKKFAVILVRPEHPENIGLVARCMKNTGFKELRLVEVQGIEKKSQQTAVHSEEILDRARLYADLKEATSDLDLIFAATARQRKNFPSISLKEALKEMFAFSPATKIGLLFGNERTGLTSDELRSSNFRFTIPQAERQPSYNLASAVLLTLFHIYAQDASQARLRREKPISRKEQEECISLVLDKLERRRFIHDTNKLHMTEMIYDLFGKFALTEKDKKLVLAIFSKAII
jgi:tRNA/rRNA methyltransferase